MAISRRGFLKRSGVLGASLILGGCSHSLENQRAAKGSKPNIIFILADDLGYGDLGCYGQKKIKTPNIDRMAKQGMRFTNHYSGHTICAPSRCCLMTGKHTGHATVRANSSFIDRSLIGIDDKDVTVATLLKKAGYVTGVTGKWGLGEAGTAGVPEKHGFDEWLGFLNQAHAHTYYPEYLYNNGVRVDIPENKNDGRGKYAHDLFTDFSIDFIRENQEKNFFLYLAYTVPHADIDVPEDSLKEYLGKFNEEPYGGGYYRAQENPNAAYAGMISRMDSDVGKINALLKKLNIDDNTLVIFSSDNGAHFIGGNDMHLFECTGPFRGTKQNLYEGGIRTPFIAKWPGIIKGKQVSDHISAFWDFLPTCCDVADIRCPAGLDGISMLPELTDRRQEQQKHKYLYWEFYKPMGGQAVRFGKWKALRCTKDVKYIELYDLEKDPGEKYNIALAHPEAVKKAIKYFDDAHTKCDHWPLAFERK
jgi:arylsulfatase A-like enzyme